mmetsp:Transcript_23861/g.49580  ORF Transcript_23861/g.49580 Transcript_23861/m.49580 type:complete len:90 (-) Transcript_23861:1845-2114(-)
MEPSPAPHVIHHLRNQRQLLLTTIPKECSTLFFLKGGSMNYVQRLYAEFQNDSVNSMSFISFHVIYPNEILDCSEEMAMEKAWTAERGC